MKHFKKYIFTLIAAVLLSACQDETSSPRPGTDEYVNNWILSNMNTYYLWNNELPAKPNKAQNPDDFFYSLLSDEDRFSWIQENYQELLNSLQGVNKEAGYEFVLYRESSGSDNVIAQVVYIKEGSPAALKDLLRGDVITHINGSQMTISNYQSLLGSISENHNITYKRSVDGVFTDKGTLSLTSVEFAENPNFLDTVYNLGDKKVGYYVYNFFATGATANSSEYINEMDQIFNSFKSKNITHLIVDLRYNSGGAETATLNLASLIGDGITTNDIFAIRQYNPQLQQDLVNEYGANFLIRKFTSKAQNVADNLSDKVYILTRNRTASASELLINSLKPFMEVVIVGDTTVGKNVGSISIYEENDPKNTWGMQPIVVKIYNSQNESAYSEGFIPNITDDDNSLEILPLGDVEENLLSLALADINGGGRIGVKGQEKHWGKMLGTSLDKKRRYFNLTIEDDGLQKLIQE